MPKMGEYALYKGDTLLSVGTIPEIAKEQNIKNKNTVFLHVAVAEEAMQER